MAERIVILCDVGYKPLDYWSKEWGRPVSTIKSWIKAGTCPAKPIGGVWMISQMELLNWEPPSVVQSAPDGKGKGRRDVRDQKVGRAHSVRGDDEQEAVRWPL